MSALWQVTAGHFSNDRESIMRNGNVFQLANGYMGFRGTLDEFGPGELVGITLAGIFDRVGDAWREPVNAPNGGFTSVSLDSQEISALSTPIKTHRQTLHLRNAVFERETEYVSNGKTIRVRSERFLSADVPNLGVIRYTVSCDSTARVRVSTGIDCNIWDLNGPHLCKMLLEKRDATLLVHAITGEAGRVVAVAEALECGFGTETHELLPKKNLRVIEWDAEAGKTYTFHKYFAVFTDQDPDGRASPMEAAIRCVNEAKARDMIGASGSTAPNGTGNGTSAM